MFNLFILFYLIQFVLSNDDITDEQIRELQRQIGEERRRAGNIEGYETKSKYAGFFMGRDEPYINTVVIGGGISGMYTTYRIVTELKKLGRTNYQDIAVFERSDRIGGRLYSPKIGQCPDAVKNYPRCELGGMRIRSGDGLMLGLTKHLDIELGDFRMQENPDSGQDSPTNPVWMRGKTLTREGVSKVLKAGNKPVKGVSPRSLPYVLGEYNASAVNVLDKVFTELQYVDVVIPVPNASFSENIGWDPCNGELNSKLLELYLGDEGAMEVFGSSSTQYQVWQPSVVQASQIFGSTDESLDLTYALSGYPTFGSLGLGTQDGYATTLLNEAKNNALKHKNQKNKTKKTKKDDKKDGDTDGGSAGGAFEEVKWYKRPLQGMQSIPLKLEKAIKYVADDNQENIFMNYELLSIERVNHEVCMNWRRYSQDQKFGDGMEKIWDRVNPNKPLKPTCYEMIFEKTYTNPCTEVTMGTGHYEKVYSERVILAMPPEKLQTVAIKTNFNNEESFKTGTGLTEVPGYHSLFNQVQSGDLVKIFLEFDERFWEKDGIHYDGNHYNFSVGRATTSSMLSNMFAWYPGTQTSPDEKSCLNDGKGGLLQ